MMHPWHTKEAVDEMERLNDRIAWLEAALNGVYLHVTQMEAKLEDKVEIERMVNKALGPRTMAQTLVGR